MNHASPSVQSPGRGPVPRVLWPPGLFLAALVIGIVAHRFAPVAVGLPVIAARCLGVVACVAAGALALWAKRVMDAAGTHIHPWKPTHALVTDGPFAHTRNPMYTALCLLLLGIGLLIPGVWPMGSAGMLLIALWRLVVAREERYLAALMGEAYLAYCRQVPRWGWRMRR